MSAKITVVDAEGTQWGPYGEEQVREYLQAGNLSETQWAMREGDADWSPLGDLLKASEPAAPVAPVVAAPRVAAAPEPAAGSPPSVASSVHPSIAPTERTPLPKPGQPHPAVAPAATPRAAPAVAAPVVAPRQVKAPQIQPAAVPAAAPPGNDPRQPAAPGPAPATKADPLVLPALIVGALCSMGGLVLLYLDPTMVLYASALVFVGVATSLYALFRGQMVPGLALLGVIVLASAAVGYLAVQAQSQRRAEAKIEQAKAKEAKEEAAIQKFAEQANAEISVERQGVLDAIGALAEDPSDDNWTKAEEAIEAYQQAMRVAGVAKKSVEMRAANQLRQAVMDRSDEAITVTLDEREGLSKDE